MPNNRHDGIPIPPLPGLGGAATPKIGPGPSNQGLGQVPDPDDLAEMFNDFTSGSMDRGKLVNSLRGISGGSGGIRTLLDNFEPGVTSGPTQTQIPSQANSGSDVQRLSSILSSKFGLDQNEIMSLFMELSVDLDLNDSAYWSLR